MKTKSFYIKSSIIFILFLSAAYILNGYDSETARIMPFVKSQSVCNDCHQSRNIDVIVRNPSKACDFYCKSCHTNMDSHHPTGMRLKGKTPSRIRPSTEEKLACYSCHDLDKRRFDSSPWKSESLYDSVFKKTKRYKTYYLVEKNDEGQLCSKCH